MREEGRKEVNMVPKFLAGAIGVMLTEVGITGRGERWVLGREWQGQFWSCQVWMLLVTPGQKKI